MNADRVLTWFAPAVVVATVAAAVVSILERWPHQFGGHGNRNHMIGDFLSGGTALAPPLVLLVIFSIAAAMVSRPGRRGTIAIVVVFLIAVSMIVGSLGEGAAAATPDVPRAVQIFSAAWGTLLGGALALLAVLTIRQRRRLPAPSTKRARWSVPPAEADR